MFHGCSMTRLRGLRGHPTPCATDGQVAHELDDVRLRMVMAPELCANGPAGAASSKKDSHALGVIRATEEGSAQSAQAEGLNCDANLMVVGSGHAKDG